MPKTKMCAYPQSYHALPHWKCVLKYCSKCTCINLPDQETDYPYFDTAPSIIFHIYHLIARCTSHGRLPLNKKEICRMCKQYSDSEKYTKIYTRKEIAMMEKTSSNFHTSFYIASIQKFVLGKNHCGDSRRTAFKRRKSFQDVSCRRNYSKSVVATFAHQIQSEYYGGNRSVYI